MKKNVFHCELLTCLRLATGKAKRAANILTSNQQQTLQGQNRPEHPPAAPATRQGALFACGRQNRRSGSAIGSAKEGGAIDNRYT
jgi:hypothetical protein